MLCGFELEFQEVNGTAFRPRRSEWQNPARYDQDLLKSLIRERLVTASAYIYNDHMMETSIPHRGEEAEHYTGEELLSIYKGLAASSALDEHQKLRLEGQVLRTKTALASPISLGGSILLTKDLVEKAKNTEDRTRPTSADSHVLDGCHVICSNTAWDIKYDGSVFGGEITSDPMSIEDNLVLIKELLQRNNFYIDKSCSFHIHVSQPGLHFKYSQAAQTELMLYILSQYDRFPDSIKERLSCKAANHYFVPHISKDKYTMVNYNQKYKTWEFRLWGNVSKYEDARICFEITKDALAHMLAVYRKEKEQLLPEFYWSESPYGKIQQDLQKKTFSWADLVTSVRTGSDLSLPGPPEDKMTTSLDEEMLLTELLNIGA